MIRRRRPRKEIEFSFDSFLDVVANVVGIILRLILVAWIAGRSYKGMVPPPPPAPPDLPEIAPLSEPADPRERLLEETRHRIARESQIARDLAGQGEAASTLSADLLRRLDEAHRQRLALIARQQTARASAEKGADGVRQASLTLDQIRTRTARVMAELEKMKKLPPLKKTLRYHTPVSAEVQTEEVMFECKQGRVSVIDTQALVKRAMTMARERANELKAAWEITGLTPPAGAFRIKFTVARERTALDGLGGQPVGEGFRYGLSGWELVPEKADRGETSARALAAGSDFRRIVDALDAKQTVVTLWVYPDSFALYRDLRDHLHGRDIVVASRPLPAGVSIGSSRKGTVSRGQ